jgi:simple sugar transport system ATP-binding protein
MVPFLEMRDIVKRFPGVIANDHINLTIEEGEIHALLGENGAGKSTLMQILYGLYQRDSGEILVQGRPVEIHSPSDAIALGIGMIHQDFMLIQPFTVVENVVVGLDEAGNGPLLDLPRAAARLKALSQQHGLAVDPNARVQHLPVGVQQRVEILKLLYRNARLLILDEPTAVLTPQEVKGLMEVVRSLRNEGHSVVFITHKLHEVMEVADRVTILRDGKVITTLNTADTNPRELARMMVGREVVFRIHKEASKPGKEILTIEDLHVEDDAGNPKVRGVSLALREGEIVGLAGVDGNGQSELAEALMNLRPVKHGRVLLDGADITHSSPAAHRKAGVAYIPADRRQVGSVGPISIAYNSILGSLRQFSTALNWLIKEQQVNAHARSLVERFDVRTPSVKLEAGKLSGGNLQKVVLGREVMRRPRLLIAEQPTRGLDVGATEFVQRQLLAERDRGAAILLISAELEEILTLSDRIAVIYGGEIMGILDAREADIETIGLMMAGTHADRLSEVPFHDPTPPD